MRYLVLTSWRGRARGACPLNDAVSRAHHRDCQSDDAEWVSVRSDFKNLAESHHMHRGLNLTSSQTCQRVRW